MKLPENDDDDLEAFLQGRDALSQRLKALQQPEPPQTLSAAIDAHVERALRDEARLPQAANDSSSGDAAAKRPRSRRLFASMALAAGLLMVVGVSLQWRQHNESATAMVAQSAAPAASDSVAKSATNTAADSRPAVAVSPAVPVRRQAAPAEMLAQAEIAPSTVVRSAPPPAPPAAAGDAKAEQWLKLIDGLLTSGMQRDALEEWREFRRAYPDYPVAPPFNARIDAAARTAAAPADSK